MGNAYLNEENWDLSGLGYRFEIVAQREDAFAVRVRPEGAESFWLKEPESRYETAAGARYAILLFLESL